MNEDMFEFQDEDDEDSEVTSKMGAKDVSSDGSNVGGSGGSVSSLKRQGKKILWIISSLLIQKWLIRIEKILKLLSTMPKRKRPRES